MRALCSSSSSLDPYSALWECNPWLLFLRSPALLFEKFLLVCYHLWQHLKGALGICLLEIIQILQLFSVQESLSTYGLFEDSRSQRHIWFPRQYNALNNCGRFWSSCINKHTWNSFPNTAQIWFMLLLPPFHVSLNLELKKNYLRII